MQLVTTDLSDGHACVPGDFGVQVTVLHLAQRCSWVLWSSMSTTGDAGSVIPGGTNMSVVTWCWSCNGVDHCIDSCVALHDMTSPYLSPENALAGGA